jgi:hypothetical protein
MAILFVILLFLISAGLGRLIFKVFKFQFESSAEEAIVAVCLGWGLIGYVIFFLGLCGLLHKKILWGILLFLGIISLRYIMMTIRLVLQIFKKANFKKTQLLYKVIILSMLFVILFTFIGALSPIIGNDSQAYRFPQIRTYISQHKVAYIPYTRESLWPSLSEMIFMLAVTLESEISAKLIEWFFAIMAIVMAYVFASRYYGKEAGVIASALFLFTPAIFMQMPFEYMDLIFTLYCFLSLSLCLKYFEKKHLRWAALAGIFYGFTLSVKYVGLIAVVSGSAAVLYYFIKEKLGFKNFLKMATVTILFTFIFSFFWYLRAYIIRGNPLYPLFAKFFNNNGWLIDSTSVLAGVGFSWGAILKFPLIFMLDWRFGGENFGIGYLLFLPFAFTLNKHKQTFKTLAVFMITYVFLWFRIVAVNNRFLFPVLFVFSIILGCGLSAQFRKKEDWFKVFLKILFIIITLQAVLLVLYHNIGRMKVVFGLESKDSYLLRNERTYEMARYIDKSLPPKAGILMINELRAYYMNRRYIHFEGLIGEAKLDPSMIQGRNLLPILRKNNIGYILYRKQNNLQSSFSIDGAVFPLPLFKTEYKTKEGILFSYALYKVTSDE